MTPSPIHAEAAGGRGNDKKALQCPNCGHSFTDDIAKLLAAECQAARIDQMTEDLGISHESIRINRDELLAALRSASRKEREQQ